MAVLYDVVHTSTLKKAYIILKILDFTVLVTQFYIR